MGLIDREEALSHPFANGKYDHKNANKHYISGFEDYKEWLEQLPVKEVDKNMELITKQEALQAVNKRIDELNTHEVFRWLKNDIDVDGVKKWIHEIKPTEAYTKEEVITMLEEIKAEIKEKEKEYLHYFFIDLDAQDKTEHEKIIDIIDQKIERLKG